MIKSTFEMVYTVHDFYDIPREGIANFYGEPHHYKCEFDALIEDWSDIYILKSIDSKTFSLAIELWQIWESWLASYHEGKVTSDTHPMLSKNPPRYFELKEILAERFDSNTATPVKVKGEFQIKERTQPKEWLVKWSPIS